MRSEKKKLNWGRSFLKPSLRLFDVFIHEQSEVAHDKGEDDRRKEFTRVGHALFNLFANVA